MANTFTYTTQRVQGISGPILVQLNLSGLTDQVQMYAMLSLDAPTFDTSKTPEENNMFPVYNGTQLAVYPDYYLSFGSEQEAQFGYKSGTITAVIENTSDGGATLDTINPSVTIDPVVVSPNPVDWPSAFDLSNTVTSSARVISGITRPLGIQISWTGGTFLSAFEASISANATWNPGTVIDLSGGTTTFRILNGQYLLFRYTDNGTQDQVNITVENASKSPVGTIDTFNMYSGTNAYFTAGFNDVYDDGGTIWTYDTRQVSGINIPVTLRVEYNQDPYNQLYYSASASPISLDPNAPPIDLVNGPMTAINDGDTFVVNDNDYIDFGILCSNHSFNDTIFVGVYNVTDNNSFVGSFNMISIN
jgi:hypothetical protein